MNLPLVIRILSTIAVLTVIVNCQEGRGDRDGILGGTFGICKSNWCKIISGSVVGVCVMCCCFAGIYYCVRGKAFRSDKTFIKIATRAQSDDKDGESIFKSGIWNGRYYQNPRWHDYYRLVLSFNSRTMNVKGLGSDNTGTFRITGVYSPRTLRMSLKKRYVHGTGNPAKNLGQTVTIQLHWNSANDQFEGKWYVQVMHYHGEGKFELKFDHEREPLTASNV